jgi:hypothetical protein
MTLACILSYAIDSSCPRPLIAREERRLHTVPSRDSPALVPGSMASAITHVRHPSLHYTIRPSYIHKAAVQASGAYSNFPYSIMDELELVNERESQTGS